MNKKKKVVNRKHKKTQNRLKILLDLSVKKRKKKPVKIIPKSEDIVQKQKEPTPKESADNKPKEDTKPKPVSVVVKSVLTADKEFNDKIGVAIDSEDVYDSNHDFAQKTGSKYKIKALKEIRKQKSLDFEIEVDGGINAETGKICVDNGADILVAGSYIYGSSKNEYKSGQNVFNH